MSRLLRSESNKSIKFDWDQSEFQKNAEQLIKDAQSQTKDILVRTSPDFSKQAAKYTPPCIGKNSIEKKYYTRPILNLIKLAHKEYKDHFFTKEDAVQLRNKMKFKVLNTKDGVKKGTAFCYTKTVAQAKRMAKIANRGISRIMWGKQLNQIGAMVPSSVQRLMDRSPNTTKHRFNEVKMKSGEDETTVQIINNVSKIQRYAKMAEQHGYKKVLNSIMRELRKLTEKKTEL